jgi:hypothetical protein
MNMTTQIMPATLAMALFLAADLTAATFPTNESRLSAGGVMPCRLPEQTNREIRQVQDQYYALAQRQANYLLTTVQSLPGHPELKSLAISTQEKKMDWVRMNAGALEGFSFLYRFGPYDEKIVGMSRRELLEKNIIPMMRNLTTSHITVTGADNSEQNWGDSWQSAHWAQMLGRAAWWLWEDLPEDLRQGVRRVIANEADHWVNTTPPHQLKDDTKAEENAWDSMIFNIAVILMPSDPRRPPWEKAFQRWALSSFLRPADEHSSALVDGRPVSEQFTGANLNDDFTLENHRRVHPDYMGAFVFTLGCALDYAMSGRQPPDAIFHNVQGIYNNLKWFYLPDGGCVYPNGEDWELFNIHDWPDIHLQLAVYCHDPDAWSLFRQCLATTDKMQARTPKGPFHFPEEYYYEGMPQIWMEELGRFWLMLQTAKQIVDHPRPPLGVKRLDSGKLILHRTPKAIHTVSWSSVIMAQCVPWRLDRVVSPADRDGVGHVQLKGERRILRVQVHAAQVSESADGFVADLAVDHGNAVRAELRFRSKADGTLVMREKLTALRDITTSEIGTGLIGILNNPKWVYETHHRRIQFDNQTTDVPALSGKIVESTEVRRIGVDGALSIEGAAPLRARYVGAKEIERGRATDELHLNYLGGERSWKEGEVISTYEAIVSPLSP